MSIKGCLKNHRWLLVGLISGLLGLVMVACGGGPSQVVIQLEELEGSGQSGTATLTAKGGETEVVIKVTAPTAPVRQPAHIHVGGCRAELGRIEFGLEAVRTGDSTTLVRVSLETLTQGGNSINIHKSLQDFRVYTACAPIPKQ